MLHFEKIEKSSYRVYETNAPVVDDIEPPVKFRYISECSNKDCVYNRSVTNTRQMFETVIQCDCVAIGNINALFYASYMLYHEVMTIVPMINKFAEIHLTDIAYEGIGESSDHSCLQALSEFIGYIGALNGCIRFYIHTDPNALVQSVVFNKRFDIISGVDVQCEFHHRDHIALLKLIAAQTMRQTGTLYISFHYADMVDISRYTLTPRDAIQLSRRTLYVKPAYYCKYKIQHTLDQIGCLCGIALQTTLPLLLCMGNAHMLFGCLFALYGWLTLTEPPSNKFGQYLYQVNRFLRLPFKRSVCRIETLYDQHLLN